MSTFSVRYLFRLTFGWMVAAGMLNSVVIFSSADEVGYPTVQALLTKYCAGCHSANESNGGFELDTHASLVAGGESGNALTPGSAASSRMLQMMLHKLEPAMPPDDEPAPTADEIQQIADWIDAGAIGPQGQLEPSTVLAVPSIESKTSRSPVTALAFTPDGQTFAVAQFGQIAIRNTEDPETIKLISDLPGKVTGLKFSVDKTAIFVATGIAGLYGEAIKIDIATGAITDRFRGHRDLVFALDVNADETRLVTAGYDRRAVIWNLQTNEQVTEIKGHNGAIQSAAFDSSGEILATASADSTVKIWRVSDGTRLDTRSEPLKEQLSVAISPDNLDFVAAGEDNRIRKWKFVSREAAESNPLEISRFAHDTAIQVLKYHPSGKWIVSSARDRTIKFWDAETLFEIHALPEQPSFVHTLAVSDTHLAVGRDDGSFELLAWPNLAAGDQAIANQTPNRILTGETIAAETELEIFDEIEPNDTLETARWLSCPLEFRGTIDAEGRTDVDLVKFSAIKGENWIIETRTKQFKSSLDTKIAVLDAQGVPVPRVQLRAVRDSYFTFRGKDSTQVGDFRVQNWEEMTIGNLLYCNGEVVRLFLYPRGPDSGFNVFPNFNNRHTLFDTTALTHALNEPLYVVEPFAPEIELMPSGLPTFMINYENDDDAEQEIGTDSRLTFTAPQDGEYYVRINDSRRFQGPDFKYELAIRRPQPRFLISKILDSDPTIFAGSYRKVEVQIDRIDGFDGPIKLDFNQLPPGIKSGGATTVEAGQNRAWLVLHAEENAMQLDNDLDNNERDQQNQESAESERLPEIVASAKIGDREVRESQSLGTIKLNEKPELLVHLLGNVDEISEIPVIEIQPGTTTTTKVSVERINYGDRVSLGNENAGINFPFGVFVDNTGLNGVLIHPEETERTIYLTAESFVEPGERLVFLEAAEAGKPTSNPAILRVLDKAKGQ